MFSTVNNISVQEVHTVYAFVLGKPFIVYRVNGSWNQWLIHIWWYVCPARCCYNGVKWGVGMSYWGVTCNKGYYTSKGVGIEIWLANDLHYRSIIWHYKMSDNCEKCISGNPKCLGFVRPTVQHSKIFSLHWYKNREKLKILTNDEMDHITFLLDKWFKWLIHYQN